MYHAKLHPEQYSDTFSDAQLKQLHASILHICNTAVDLLADSSKFPEEWLFKHRWGKGKKDSPTALPNGAKITFLTVGGRTSCVVPSIQKKTGAVAGDVKVKDENDGSENEDVKTPAPKTGKRQPKKKAAKEDETTDREDITVDPVTEDVKVKTNGRKRKAETTPNNKTRAKKTGSGARVQSDIQEQNPPSRRSTRTRK